jgi:hypothetical protein
MQLTLLSQRKLALTAIHFLHYEIIGAPQKFKNQPHPLLKPSSVNFCKLFEFYLMRQSLQTNYSMTITYNTLV